MEAADAVETIQREMTAFARRARASAGRMHPELSLVSYTLLGHLEESGGCRATDLAAHYALDKSTVSRQVAALERAGLIDRRQDPAGPPGPGAPPHRRRTAHPRPGHREPPRARSTSGSREWPAGDLERFAAYLVRYNAAAAGRRPGRPRAELRHRRPLRGAVTRDRPTVPGRPSAARAPVAAMNAVRGAAGSPGTRRAGWRWCCRGGVQEGRLAAFADAVGDGQDQPGGQPLAAEAPGRCTPR